MGSRTAGGDPGLRDSGRGTPWIHKPVAELPGPKYRQWAFARPVPVNPPGAMSGDRAVIILAMTHADTGVLGVLARSAPGGLSRGCQYWEC
jgi:hypothetical protein